MRKIAVVLALTMALSLVLWGCIGVEAEKREYPQVIGIDREQELYEVIYAVPNMQASTGQEKSGEDSQASVLGFRGKNMDEIENSYNKTQEKYLDLGHVKVLILGPGIRQNHYWEEVLKILKEKPVIGEDIYVFYTQDLGEVMKYNGTKTDSLGDYLTGIYENRPSGEKKQGVTLRQVYKTWYEKGELCDLPEITIQEQGYLSIE